MASRQEYWARRWAASASPVSRSHSVEVRSSTRVDSQAAAASGQAHQL
jgi:hypothetical protein